MEVRVVTKGYPEAIAYLDAVRTRLLNDRTAGLVRAVRRIGDVWKDNFDTEGSRVGGWAPLAEYTQADRAELGFSPDHPILRRDGALRNVVIDLLTSQTSTSQGQSRSERDTYSDQVTTSALTLDGGHVTISAHGWKVANQYDTRGDRFGHPARPFWFVDDAVLYAARSGVVDWLTDVFSDDGGLL